MKIFIPYQPIDAMAIPLCIQAIQQHLAGGPHQIEIVGPPLARKMAAEMQSRGITWTDESQVIPGLTRDTMPEILFQGRDIGQKLFTQILTLALGTRSTEVDFAVIRPNLIFVSNIELSDGTASILPAEGVMDPSMVDMARRLLGTCNPRAAFSKYVMSFKKTIVERLLAKLTQLTPGKNFAQVILETIDRNNPAFSANDLYAWFAMETASDRVKIGRMSTLVVPRDLSDRHQVAANLALSRQCQALFYEPGWLQEVEVLLAEVAKIIPLESIQVMLDVGSRDAEVSLSAKRRLPNARIFAFECNPDAVRLCRSNLRGQSEITLVENAVNNVSGPVSFFSIDPLASVTPHMDGNIGASSLFKADHAYPYEKYAQKEITVQGITLEEWARNAGINAVDMIWIDLQGAELAAFQGMGPLLKTVKVIYTEVEYKQMYKGQPTHHELAAFMQANGFRLFQRMNTSEWFGNEMYVREDLMSALPAQTQPGNIRVVGATRQGGRIISFGKPS